MAKWTATRRKRAPANCCSGVGIPVEQHYGPMSESRRAGKLRVLLAQALFSNPDILLLMNRPATWTSTPFAGLEQTLNNRDSTMIIISHDRHFLNMVCTTWRISTTASCACIRATTTNT